MKLRKLDGPARRTQNLRGGVDEQEAQQIETEVIQLMETWMIEVPYTWWGGAWKESSGIVMATIDGASIEEGGNGISIILAPQPIEGGGVGGENTVRGRTYRNFDPITQPLLLAIGSEGVETEQGELVEYETAESQSQQRDDAATSDSEQEERGASGSQTPGSSRQGEIQGGGRRRPRDGSEGFRNTPLSASRGGSLHTAWEEEEEEEESTDSEDATDSEQEGLSSEGERRKDANNKPS